MHAPITSCSKDGGSSARHTHTYPSHSRTATLISPYSTRSMSGIFVRFGAATSVPSRPYVHAWYVHWNARLTSPAGSVHSAAPRWRHTLRNARIAPSRPRDTSTLSRPTRTVRNCPGRSSSDARAAQNHIVSKILACSAANTSGSV